MIAAAALQIHGVSAPAQVPPSPRTIHQRNPDLSINAYTYVCGGIERRFMIGLDQTLRPQFVSASRDGHEVDYASIAAVTAIMRRFDGISYVRPQCNPVRDRITVMAIMQRQRYEFLIDWEGDRLTTEGPWPLPTAMRD